MRRLLRRRRGSPLSKPCSACGSAAECGYSEHAEEALENIRPFCRRCVRRQLGVDYARFGGRAVVVQPVAGPPVYVFQPVDTYRHHCPEHRISDDVLGLLNHIARTCDSCSEAARFVWVESRGLTGATFGQVLEHGISATLLAANSAPNSLCAGCCARRVCDALEAGKISYLEMCSPSGDEPGFVLPMGY